MSLWVAFTAGLVSFASPCVLPLIPTYIIYLTGSSLTELTEVEEQDPSIVINAISFILGFSLIFIAFGATATFLGMLMIENQVLLRKISGVVIILFGLYTLEIFKFAPLYREARIDLPLRGPSPLNSFLMGMAFSAGWTPCVGPVLGSILILAGNRADMVQGIYLLLAYSLGLGIPFFLAAIFINYFLKAIRRLNQYLPTIKMITGALLVVAGWMTYTGIFNMLFI